MDCQVGQELTVYGIGRWKEGKLQKRKVVVHAHNPQTGLTYVETPRGALLTLGVEVFLSASEAATVAKRKLDLEVKFLQCHAKVYKRMKDRIDEASSRLAGGEPCNSQPPEEAMCAPGR